MDIFITSSSSKPASVAIRPAVSSALFTVSSVESNVKETRFPDIGRTVPESHSPRWHREPPRLILLAGKRLAGDGEVCLSGVEKSIFPAAADPIAVKTCLDCQWELMIEWGKQRSLLEPQIRTIVVTP